LGFGPFVFLSFFTKDGFDAPPHLFGGKEGLSFAKGPILLPSLSYVFAILVFGDSLLTTPIPSSIEKGAHFKGNDHLPRRSAFFSQLLAFPSVVNLDRDWIHGRLFLSVVPSFSSHDAVRLHSFSGSFFPFRFFNFFSAVAFPRIYGFFGGFRRRRFCLANHVPFLVVLFFFGWL